MNTEIPTKHLIKSWIVSPFDDVAHLATHKLGRAVPFFLTECGAKIDAESCTSAPPRKTKCETCARSENNPQNS